MAEENPECSGCGAEILEALSVSGGSFAPWLCLECSGATLSDFCDCQEHCPKCCEGCAQEEHPESYEPF